MNEPGTTESFGFNILDIIYCDSGDECIDSSIKPEIIVDPDTDTYFNEHTGKDMNLECIVLFSDCDFKGDHIEICEDNRDLTIDFPRTRSIFIPENYDYLPVTLFS